MLMQARILTVSFLGALVAIALAVSFILPVTDSDAALPVLWVAAGQVVLGLGLHTTLDLVGYRAQPISSTASAEEAEGAARAAWNTTTMLRLALAESIALISVVLAFVDGQAVLYYVGGAVSVVLMLVHAWPWSRPVARVQAALDSQGGRSRLSTLLEQGDGVIREL